MDKHLRSKRIGEIRVNYKFILGLLVIAGLAISFAACGLLGPKQEPPPPQPAPAPPTPKLVEPPAPKPEPPPPPPAPKEEPPPPPPPVEKKEEPKPEVAPPPPPPPAPTEVYVVTLKNTNVRQEPTTKSKVITTLKKGMKIEKMGQTGNWVNVKLPSGEMGWIFHDLLKDADSP